MLRCAPTPNRRGLIEEREIMTLIDQVAEEFRTWIEAHPDRAEAALDGLAELESSIMQLPPSQAAAITDLNNMLARALGKD